MGEGRPLPQMENGYVAVRPGLRCLPMAGWKVQTQARAVLLHLHRGGWRSVRLSTLNSLMFQASRYQPTQCQICVAWFFAWLVWSLRNGQRFTGLRVLCLGFSGGDAMVLHCVSCCMGPHADHGLTLRVPRLRFLFSSNHPTLPPFPSTPHPFPPVFFIINVITQCRKILQWYWFGGVWTGQVRYIRLANEGGGNHRNHRYRL